MAMPILRSGMPWGQLKLTSKASTPTSSQRPMSSSQGPWLYSSMMEAISTLHPHPRPHTRRCTPPGLYASVIEAISTLHAAGGLYVTTVAGALEAGDQGLAWMPASMRPLLWLGK